MNNQNPNNNRNYNSQNNNPNYNNDQYNNYPNDQYNQYNEQYNNPDYNGQYNNPGYTGQHYDNQNTQYNNTVNDQQYYNQQNNQQYNVPPVNPNYNNYNDNNSYNEEPKNEKKKSPIPIIITAIVTFLVLVVALYFGYNKFMKKENVVDVSAYEINFVTYGTNGEGKPEVDIKKIPEVANTSTEISNFLSKPDISYDKKENLKNGDKVEVTITLNHNTAQKLKLDTKGEFKRTFTVNGLNEKEKEKEKPEKPPKGAKGSAPPPPPPPQEDDDGGRSAAYSGAGFAYPVRYAGVSSPFGNRFHPVLKRYILHTGVDLVAKYVPLRAAKSGVVTFAGNMSGYGKIIIIRHDNGYETRYAHLSVISTNVGEHVNQGDLIGKTGNSGRTTGAHLHFEIRQNGVPKNPMKYLR